MDRRVVWITGAGSGMGAAIAAEVAPGRRVALSGRSSATLEASAAAVRDRGGEALVVPLDVADRDAVHRAVADVEQQWGAVDVAVLAAGTNSPRRSWADQDMAGFDQVLATNLGGVVAVVDAVLPSMRSAGGGQVVVIGSYAGWHLSSMPGVAYSAAKQALGSVIYSLNAQENRHGIRATLLCPGDVDTGFLRMRPEMPSSERRATMLRPDDVARTVGFVLSLPGHVVVDEMVVTPLSQDR